MEIFYKVWLILIGTIVVGGLVGGPTGIIVGVLIYIAVMESMNTLSNISSAMTNLEQFANKEDKK